MNRFDVYRRLVGYLRPYWRQVLLAYTAMLAATLLNLLVPQIIAWAIDQGLAIGYALALLAASALILYRMYESTYPKESLRASSGKRS